MADEEVVWKGDYFRLPIEDQVFISRISETAVWIYKEFFMPIGQIMDSEFIDGDLVYERVVERFAPHIYLQKEVLRYVDEQPFDDDKGFDWEESGDNPMHFFPVDEHESDPVNVHEVMILACDMLKNYRIYRGIGVVDC